MPELPEVERAARILRPAVVGRAIADLLLLHPALAARVPPPARDAVRGRVVTRVERRAKYQLLHLDDGGIVVVHFRMSGDWAVGRTGEPIAPHARAVLDLDDGTRVSLIDPRALATVTVHRPGETVLPPLGPEPDDPAFTARSLGETLARRRGPIKPVLLDQRAVAGVGNIYAAEALWEAGISPRAAAARLGPRRRQRLVEAIRAVLRRAGEARYYGSGGDGAPEWRVYDREGEPCARCGAAIRRIVQAGRSTYFCAGCQRP